MQYYRDILLIPKFDNMDIINNIRKDCDELYDVIEPHITLVFPFINDISDEELVKKIRKYFFEKQKFHVKFKGVAYSNDNYIFLKCIVGEDNIIKLHDDLYNKYFKDYLSKLEFIPHITIGQTFNCSDEKIKMLNNMQDEFECDVDTVVIEKIGINNESIVIDEIKLK